MTSLMRFILIITLTVSYTVFAFKQAPSFKVLDVQGDVFLFSGAKQNMKIRKQMLVPMGSKVMVTDTGSLSLVDNKGTAYHIAPGGHFVLEAGSVKIQSGKVWVVANSNYARQKIETPNATSFFQTAEFIFSYDDYTSRTQLLVLGGETSFANNIERDLQQVVYSGYFSFVDQQHNNGMPRRPTRVGLTSYKSLRMAFSDIESLKNHHLNQEHPSTQSNSRARRSIASVGSSTGKIYIIKKHKPSRSPSSVGAGVKRSNIIRIFDGTSPSPKYKKDVKNTSRKSTHTRAPASIAKSSRIVQDLNTTFEKSLQKKLENNKRHSDEVNGLINDLKSYKSDFSKSY